MARETLRELEGDVLRLLAAGGAMAARDEGLRARGQVLAALGAKVPALGKVAEQIARVGDGSRGRSTEGLLGLAALTVPLRAAQLAPASALGELAPLPSTEPLSTDGDVEGIERALRALGGRDGGALPGVVEPSELAIVCDLRMFDPWLRALAGSGSRVGATRALALIAGMQNVSPEHGFEMHGDDDDAAWLRALGRLRAPAITELLVRAVEGGSVPVAAAALATLGAHDRARAESLAHRLLLSDRLLELKRAALSTLAEVPSDRALAALLDALDVGALRATVVEILRVFPHPAATTRLLARFAADAEALRSGTEGSARLTLQRLEAVVTALGSRPEPTVLTALADTFQAHPSVLVRVAAGRALLARGDREARAILDLALEDEFAAVRTLAVEAIFAEGLGAADARLAPYFAPERLASTVGLDVALEALCWLGRDRREHHPAWVARCLALLEDPRLADEAAAALASMGAREACDRLLALFEARLSVQPEAGHTVLVNALVRLEESRLVPLLLRMLQTRTAQTSVPRRRELYEALRDLGDPSALAPLRLWARRWRHDRHEHSALEELLQSLARDAGL